ncbi:hypothetical protein PsorP6_008769 [Peronosclerospora sorghi]|uniref:Uncharacterized protein n=1 Tax=Peronosclerospora sorghi TaxID=230839 RepID=A0ACC0VX75_9STRA|nr:hypothetical protein PsorP6_008769 [Peronosclerospora sorghi]
MSRLRLLWALVVQEEEEEEELRDQQLWLEIARVRLSTRFYGSRPDLRHLYSMFGIPPTTARRCLAKAEEVLSLALDSVADAEVRCPTAQEQVASGRLVETREPLVTKKFGFIDGKNYQVKQPSRAEVQNAY